MANPLNEAEDVENQLAEFERLMNESDVVDEEEPSPSVGDAGPVT